MWNTVAVASEARDARGHLLGNFKSYFFFALHRLDDYRLADQAIHSKVSRRKPVPVKHIMPAEPSPVARRREISAKAERRKRDKRKRPHRKLKKGDVNDTMRVIRVV